MMKWLTYLLGTLLVIGCISCEKEHRGDCLKRTGPMETEVRELENFRKLSIEGRMNVRISMDTANSIEIEAGDNLMDGLVTEIISGKLFIYNNNRCNWARSYKKEINMHLRLKRLVNIEFMGSGNIESTDTLHLESMEIHMHQASGSVDLTMQAESLKLDIKTGPGDITIKGKSQLTELFSGGNGTLELSQLNSRTVLLNNSGTGDFEIYVEEAMWGSIHGDGNVYFSGPGEVKELTTTANGKLLFR